MSGLFLGLFLAQAAAVVPLDQVDTKPDWAELPNAEVIGRVSPSKAIAQQVDGKATVSCIVTTQGLLTKCSVVSEEPAGYGFGKALLKASKHFRFHPAMKDGQPVATELRVPMAFYQPRPGDMPGGYRLKTWASREQVGAHWPAAADPSVQRAHADLECVIATTGAFEDCKVVGETPAGVGFGEAALSLMPRYAMEPLLRDGRPAAGPYRLRIRFERPTPPKS